jgi:hypothetical protein
MGHSFQSNRSEAGMRTPWEQPRNMRRVPDLERDERATAGVGSAARSLSSPANLLWLQQRAGNRAVSSVAHVIVQRCGDAGPERCACEQETADPPQQVAVQRQPTGDACTTALIGEDDWKVKGTKTARGYDTGDYYKDVAREILHTGEASGVEFDRALFVVAQARAEQGMGDPKHSRFRVLNITVSDADSKGAKPMPGHPEIFETLSGRKFQNLRTKENDPVCTRLGLPLEPDGQCTVTSRFYVYDSIGEQTRHYLDEMTKGRPGVMDILTKKKGTPGEKAGIKDFGTALKGYGSDPNYAAKLCANYNDVVRDMTTILNKAIQTKNDCLPEARKKLADAWDEFNKAHKQHADAHAAKDPERIKRAQEDIRRVEKLVKQREDEVRWIEDAIKKLEARRAGLTKEANCPPAKKATTPPPTP